MQLLHDQVLRNHTTREDHGDEQEVGQQGTARHVILVQNVTTEGCERKTEECTNDSCDDGVQERTEQFRRCEDRLVTAEGRIIRPELETVDTDSVEGVGYNFPDRNNDNQGKNCEDDIKNYIKKEGLVQVSVPVNGETVEI